MFTALTLFSGPYAILARIAVLGIFSLSLMAFGAFKMHAHDKVAYEHLRQEYANFHADVTAKGKAAQTLADRKTAADKVNKEESDHAHTQALAALNTRITILRQRTDNSRNIVPSAAADSRNPEDITFDRAILEREIRGSITTLRAESRPIVDEGSKAVIDIDSVKPWALKMTPEIR